MGLISFLKNAGARIFNKPEAVAEVDKGVVIINHLKSFGFDTSEIKAEVTDDVVILTGRVDTLPLKNKIVVAAGNVEGIARVEDRMIVLPPGNEIPVILPEEPEKQFYTVVSGDSLSKIAKQFYGNAGKYPLIFEANKPMLTHPDKIYPGQVLVIPPVE